MSLASGISLLKELQIFTEETGSEDMALFAEWLHERYNGKAAVSEGPTGSEAGAVEREIGYLLGRIARYSRYYAKVAFEDLPINTIEEFWFLNVAFHAENPSKTEIYESTITELATGTQMMRRLVSLKLLKEHQDRKDKRVRRVHLTALGKKVRNKAFQILGTESMLKVGNLSSDDRLELLATLRYLDGFHRKIHTRAGELSLTELLDEYCP